MDDLRPLPLLDWYGIFACHVGIDSRGEAWLQEPPLGVKLTQQEGRKSAVFIEKERPWEQGILTPICVIREGPTLRMWYDAKGAQDNAQTFVAYVESDDGFCWRRPELGIVEFNGSTKNNLLFPTVKFDLQSVFIDPLAPADERYKAIAPKAVYYYKGVPQADFTKQQARDLRKKLAEAGITPEVIGEEVYFHGIVKGAVSADGLSWRFIEKPLLDVGRTGLDSQNIAAYDPDAGLYIAYLRGHLERRRIVRRSEGKAFADWSPTRVVLVTDGLDAPDDDIYSSCYCRYPGGGPHLMFPSFYHRMKSDVDLHFAASRDGLVWIRPERKPIVSRQTEKGEYGQMYGSPNLVPLTGDEWGLMVFGTYGKHDWGVEGSEVNEWRWATWKRDRLVALEAPVEGRVTLVERPCAGREMLINYSTDRGGWVKVELVYPPSTPPSPVKPFDGFGIAEADVLSGDEVAGVVTWKGNCDLASLKGEKMSVRITMARTRVFSVAV